MKLINCQVPQQHEAAFTKGQRVWHELAGLDGFLGQLGGWLVERPKHAVIIGLWRDESAYQNFMADHHDTIADSSGQSDYYDSIAVTRWPSNDSNLIEQVKLPEAIAKANSLLLTYMGLPPIRDRQDGIVHEPSTKVFQQSTSLLAKLSFISQDKPHRTLTCVLCQFPEEKESGQLHSLAVTLGLRMVNGEPSQATLDTLHIEPSWTVRPLPSAH